MTISPKRMAQIIEEQREDEDRIAAAVRVFNSGDDYLKFDGDTFESFIQWAATDPTPKPLTVADLNDADRLGYAASTAHYQDSDATNRMYLRDRDRFNTGREIWNAQADAVIAEDRAMMAERGDVIVRGDRDKNNDAAIFLCNTGSADVRCDLVSARKGIDAVIARHAAKMGGER